MTRYLLGLSGTTKLTLPQSLPFPHHDEACPGRISCKFSESFSHLDAYPASDFTEYSRGRQKSNVCARNATHQCLNEFQILSTIFVNQKPKLKSPTANHSCHERLKDPSVTLLLSATTRRQGYYYLPTRLSIIQSEECLRSKLIAISAPNIISMSVSIYHQTNYGEIGFLIRKSKDDG